MRIFLSVLLSTAALFVVTRAEAKPVDVCFSSSFVTSFEAKDSSTLRIHEAGKAYDLKVSFCSQLQWADTIGFESFGGSFVCRGDKVILADFTGRVIDRCYIDSITELKHK